MSFKTTIEELRSFFTGLFNAAKAEWEKFSPELQAATTQASAIIAIINANIGAVPTDIWSLIQLKFPNITETQVISALATANNAVNSANAIASDATIEEAITTIQSYLAKLGNGEFITVVKSIVTIIADVFAPNETIIQKVEAVLEYVYQELVKPHVTVVETPVVETPVVETPVVETPVVETTTDDEAEIPEGQK